MRVEAWLISVLLVTIPISMMGEGDSPPIEPERNDSRNIVVRYCFEAPVLDGKIEVSEWDTLNGSNYFDAFDSMTFREIYPSEGSDEEFTDPGDLAVDFYILYDDTYLYFAANVTDQNIVIDSDTTFWRDDGVELLIDGSHDMDWDQRAGDP